jgi:penicillin-binding protein 1B
MIARRAASFAAIASASLLAVGLALSCSLGPRPRLSEQVLPLPTRVYGRSLTLEPGARSSLARIEQHLRAAGYQAAPAAKELLPGQFRASGRRFELRARRLPYPGAPAPEALIAGTLDAASAIAELSVDGEPARRVVLETPLLASLAESGQDRELVRLEDLPLHVIDAVLMTEDRRFYSHIGVDPIRVFGAALENAKERRVAQGGSTITQQLVKNVYLSPERTFTRKLKEVFGALWLELRYSKDEILEAYLNEIYLGQDGALGIHGVARAARFYFGKDVKQLSVADAALLAALIRGPNALSPFKHPAAAKARRDLILDVLLEERLIEPDAHAQAKAQPLGVKRERARPSFAAHFVGKVRADLAERVDEDALSRAGFSVFTTLDAGHQAAAEAAVDESLAALERSYPRLRRAGKPLQAALVALDARSGDVLAYVGGRKAARGTLDRVINAHRQPGSVFKPVVALAALSRDLDRELPVTLATILEDEPLEIIVDGEPWGPANHDRRFRGPVTVRRALEDSLNVPFTRLALEVGLVRVAETARELGVESPLRPIPSLALGAFEMTPLEVARTYGVFASGGRLRTPRATIAVRQPGGGDFGGELAHSERVFPEEPIYLVTSALIGAVERGTGRSLRALGVHGPFAGKTGTTNDLRDAWFAGYTPELVVVAWVGFDDGARVGLTGAQGAIPLVASFVKRALGAEGWPDFEPPQRLIKADVDPATGLRSAAWCGSVEEIFLRGTAPSEVCPKRKRWWRWW